jgi:queuine tRNA-ribosyltransferase
MAWDGPILTDSGGFQVFSLSGLRRLTPDGVEFASHIDGSKHFFSPEKVVSIQQNLGSDIMMVLDECVPYGADFEYTKKSLALTTAWAAAAARPIRPSRTASSFSASSRADSSRNCGPKARPQITSLGFDGHALGGISVGEPRPEMHAVIDSSAHLLPDHKPRYLMGVGAPQDILAGVAAGVDLFDCVLATRNAETARFSPPPARSTSKRPPSARTTRRSTRPAPATPAAPSPGPTCVTST